MRLTNEMLEARLGPPDEHQVFALYGDIGRGTVERCTHSWDLLAFQGWLLVRVPSQPQRGWVTEARLYRTTLGDFVGSIDVFPEKAHRPDPRAAALACRQPTLEAAGEWFEVVGRGVTLVDRATSLASGGAVRPTLRLTFDPAAAVAALEQAQRLIDEITKR